MVAFALERRRDADGNDVATAQYNSGRKVQWRGILLLPLDFGLVLIDETCLVAATV
jgi:hypothetical protein